MSEIKGIPMDHNISIDDELWRHARGCVPDEMTDSEVVTLALAMFVRLKAVKSRLDSPHTASEVQKAARTTR
jgi:hypothetical protein